MAKKKKKKAKKKTEAKTTPSRRRVGKSSGLGIIATWVQVFATNAKAHLTDAQILSKMKINFPEQSARSKIFNSVKKHRSLYNRGVLTKGKKPEKKSVAYEPAGEKK